jgi:Flp pilus assembly protein TadD
MFKILKMAAAAAALTTGVAVSGAAHAEWLKAESPHFVVYGDTSEGAIREYTRKVERFDSIIRVFFPVPSNEDAAPLAIYLADGRSDMRKIWPDISENIGGFYTAGPERIFAVTGGRGSDNDHTLFHEYAHHFMMQYMPGAYPGWFIEGFAEFFATADVTVGRMKVGLPDPGRLYSLQGGPNSWMPMETLLRSRPMEVRRQGHAYYAQAWALTAYFMSTPERTAMLGRYLSAVMNGEDRVTSMTTATGRTPVQLQADVSRYLQRMTYRWQDREFEPAEITVTRLPPSTRDLVWLDLRLARFVPEDLRAANLAEAQRAFDRYPGDGLAARVLAQAHMDMQQDQDAVRILGDYVSTRPDDALALRMKAVALMNVADEDEAQRSALYREARSALATAYEQDPTDYRTFMAMARNREGQPDYPTANDVQVLVLGSQLAPQVQELRFDAGQALMSSGQYAQAVAYLAPIANDPHGGENLNAVRQLLAEARTKAGLAASADEAAPAADEPDEETSAPS